MAPPGAGGGRSQVFRHYLPVLVGLAVIVLVVVLVPSSVPPSTVAPAATGPNRIPDAPNSPGVAVSGVRCGGGARQVTWSDYAPLCQPRFSGSNGGATSPGVTRTTITVTSRQAITPGIAAAIGSIGSSLVGSNLQTQALMQAYIDVFNKEFELYGRKVVLKPFTGRGDFEIEQSGSGQAEAQQDADTAKAMGAFADVSTLSETATYAQALVQNQVISVGAPYVSTSFLQQNAPYAFTVGPSCNELSSITDAVVGRGLGTMPAIFAGDPALRSRHRVIGVAYPDSATFQTCDAGLVATLRSQYHVHVGPVVTYPFTELGNQEEAANMIAQFKSAGVTTVFCGCDPAMINLATTAANTQQYHPEWVNINTGDAYNRFANQAQFSHDLAAGQVEQPTASEEPATAYKLADDPKTALIPSYATIYAPLLLLFDALQAAGPDLTPTTLERGFQSLPASLPGGMYGQWKFGAGRYSASATFQVEYWDPTAVSPSDGQAGAYRPCNRATEYADVGQPRLPAGQLDCFGSTGGGPSPPAARTGAGSRT
jgi:hypothetical protein